MKKVPERTFCKLCPTCNRKFNPEVHILAALFWTPSGGWVHLCDKCSKQRIFANCIQVEKREDSGLRMCPFKSCPTWIHHKHFACQVHWAQLSSEEQHALADFYKDYLDCNIDLVELKKLQRQILGNR